MKTYTIGKMDVSEKSGRYVVISTSYDGVKYYSYHFYLCRAVEQLRNDIYSDFIVNSKIVKL